MAKRLFAIVCVLVLTLTIVPIVGAQVVDTTRAPGTWVSSINIQNTGTTQAYVVLDFYSSTGANVLNFVVDPPIVAGGSRSLYVPTQIPGLSDGQYSVIASSDQPLQVVANSTSTSPSTAGAYTGLQSSEIGSTPATGRPRA